MNNNKKLKQYELKILDKITEICNKHNLKYYLAFGSALGAIRHSGFIPWDDDIDIQMPLDDLIKFKEICKKELSSEFYVQDKLTDKYYYNYWTKIGLENTTWMPKARLVNCKYGICVDIFPIFKSKDTEEDKKRIEKYTKVMLRTTAKYYVINNKEYSFGKRLVHRLIPRFINNMMHRYALNKLNIKGDDYDSLVVTSMDNNRNIYFKKDIIIGNKKLEFEKRKLFVPNDIDAYLKVFYGDYMKLPPKNKRYGHDTGNDIIYDFDKSYKEYMEE